MRALHILLAAKQATEEARLRDALGDGEVDDAQLPLAVDEQVVGLDIAMHPAAGVDVRQPGRRLLEDAVGALTDGIVLLLDEPSLGIAPILVKTIFERIKDINERLGVTILLVEQNAQLALKLAHYAYVFESGEIILHGPAGELANNSVSKS